MVAKEVMGGKVVKDRMVVQVASGAMVRTVN
jgi:hypothetical protein